MYLSLPLSHLLLCVPVDNRLLLPLLFKLVQILIERLFLLFEVSLFFELLLDQLLLQVLSIHLYLILKLSDGLLAKQGLFPFNQVIPVCDGTKL